MKDFKEEDIQLLIKLQTELLTWNRGLDKPLITVGYEYGVASAVLKILQGEAK